MYGERHALAVHLLNQQTDSLYHDNGVAGLDGYDHVHEVLFHAYTQELHATLHHAGGCVAVTAHDAVGE